MVKRLIIAFHRMGHVVVMGNFFASMQLFELLLSNGTYATCIVYLNKIEYQNF